MPIISYNDNFIAVEESTIHCDTKIDLTLQSAQDTGRNICILVSMIIVII